MRSLALVQMKINFQLHKLAQMLEKGTLQDLDISANNCVPLHFVPLLLALAHNKTLHTLNLSQNQLLDKSDQTLRNAKYGSTD